MTFRDVSPETLNRYCDGLVRRIGELEAENRLLKELLEKYGFQNKQEKSQGRGTMNSWQKREKELKDRIQIARQFGSSNRIEFNTGRLEEFKKCRQLHETDLKDIWNRLYNLNADIILIHIGMKKKPTQETMKTINEILGELIKDITEELKRSSE